MPSTRQTGQLESMGYKLFFFMYETSNMPRHDWSMFRGQFEVEKVDDSAAISDMSVT